MYLLLILAFSLTAAFSLAVANVQADDFTVYTEPLPPVHFEVDGKIVGIATEIVEEIFRQAGHQAKIEIYPWKRSYFMVQKNKNQFIFTINRTPKRETLFKWIGPILTKRTYLYKLRGRDDIQITSLEEAKKWITAVILGHSLTNTFEELGFQEDVNMIKTTNKSIQTKLFLNKRCDLITGNEYTIYRAMKSAGLSMNDIEPALFISSSGYYLGAHPDTNAELVDQLQNAAEKIYQSAFAEKIISKYMSQ